MEKLPRFAVIVHSALWALLLAWTVDVVLMPLYNARPPFGIYVVRDNGIMIYDFPSHFNFVKAVWSGSAASGRTWSAYSVAHHLRINSDWSGLDILRALPFGYSPTMLWVLAPFVPLTHASAFCLFTLAGLLVVWWQTYPLRSWYGVGLLAYFSSIALAGFELGQTAFLTGAGLLFIQQRSLNLGAGNARGALLQVAVVIWALTAKPPLAVTAVVVLCGLRLWQPVALAALLTATSTLLLWPLLGADWWRDYIQMLTHYNQVQAVPEYAWSLHPEIMANLRGVLSVDLRLPDDLASRIAAGTWVFVLAVIAGLGPYLKMTAGGLWGFGLLSYLAFCPHVSATEDIQLILLLPFCVPPEDSDRFTWREPLVSFAVLVACFISPAYNDTFSDNRLLLFSVKMCIMAFLILCLGKTRVAAGSQT